MAAVFWNALLKNDVDRWLPGFFRKRVEQFKLFEGIEAGIYQGSYNGVVLSIQVFLAYFVIPMIAVDVQ